MIHGCPNRGPTAWLIVRAAKSLPPPGSDVTMRIGLIGYVCATAAHARRLSANGNAAIVNTFITYTFLLIIVVLILCRGRSRLSGASSSWFFIRKVPEQPRHHLQTLAQDRPEHV